MSLTSANVVMSGVGTGINVYQDHNAYTKAGLTGADYDAAMASSVIVETVGTALATGAVIGVTIVAAGAAVVPAGVVAIGVGAGFLVSLGYDSLVKGLSVKGHVQEAIRENASIENPYTLCRDK